MYTRTHIYVHVYTYIHMHIDTQTISKQSVSLLCGTPSCEIWTCAGIYIYIYINIYIYTYIYTQNIYIYIYIYTYIYTHTPFPQGPWVCPGAHRAARSNPPTGLRYSTVSSTWPHSQLPRFLKSHLGNKLIFSNYWKEQIFENFFSTVCSTWPHSQWLKFLKSQICDESTRSKDWRDHFREIISQPLVPHAPSFSTTEMSPMSARYWIDNVKWQKRSLLRKYVSKVRSVVQPVPWKMRLEMLN